MKKDTQIKVLIAAHLGLMVLAYNITPFLTKETYHFHFKLVALAWVLPAVALLKLMYPTASRGWGIVFVMFSMNNFFDEILHKAFTTMAFNNTELQLNELIFAILTILWVVKDKFKR